ncbi:helix-turn-helix domain-containing protein [Sulfurimonas sp.]|uniref:helix-turn-helix domain-containing protein n=1 Tax=Sulfurimonas sp. TaxID=2022749 RepID=UPI003D136A97
MSAEKIIEKLMNYYNVSTLQELAHYMNVTQPMISRWKKNNSVAAIRKKCVELDIIDQIFEHQNTKNDQIFDYQSINNKLFNFSRRSLIYLYFLLQKTNIKNAIDYYSYLEQKETNNKFKNFIDEFFIDLKNDNISFTQNSGEAEQFVTFLLKNDEIDYIFSNKDLFLKSILFISKQKR